MRFDRLQKALNSVEGDVDAAQAFIEQASRVFLIGNGGSAAIASHMATDFTKNADIPASAFNDVSLLTCFANDFGHEHMFSQALYHYARDPDWLLVAISSSGRSRNIINAVDYARRMHRKVVTMSGFDASNPLRQLGDVNLYVPAHDYGSVEITHLAILHSMVPV
jgi:D-sedoheptulose 7-phosphate isomerase